ncbi:disease resistance protein RPV1 isoform X2 [Medicago truncatula]|uniref:disease resistance protein RPV1 isoform X2 n=1 Tax=Medicago truncatula TaxID=3880 RepID=UPI000D2F1ED0|nr:disease resistance protein RPV1 isoform X2 [Medicago truncatula]
MLHRSHSLMASLTDRFKYDLFLSFRGEDTRHGFTGNLWKALSDRGIHTFMDDEELQKGEEITPSLIKAIEDSNMAIIVLSKNYASSTFCLKELSTILYSIKDKGRCVWPVFYDVEPSDVRKLKRSYGEAMVEHEARDHSNMDLLQKWKNALNQVANLSGFHFKNGDEYEHVFIGKIVEQVSREIIPATLPVPDYLVGLEYQKQHVTSLLNDGPNDKVQMVGIHGIGGIGKTTLALAVYNSIVHQFQGSCFLEKVRENSDKNGLIHLQKILLSQVVGEKNIELTSVRQGISILQKRFHQKKVLLLLDDVDKEEQLEAIAGRSDWFGRGSRVIITTRDKRLLTYHGVERTYEEEEKSVFLDIACCFKGYKWTRVEQILNAHYDNIMKDHIDVLVEKSLIKTSMSGNVTLHDLIEDMGKEIVRQESPEDPGKRSRLWSSKDIIQVLEENTGTSKIEIICPSSRIEVEWDEEAFKKMENLRTLIIMDGQFTESPKNLPNSLRILEHHLYPSWGLPSQFYPRKLAICKIPSYSTSFAWDDFFKKKFKNIRVLSFDHHKSLTRIPDISGLVNLEELSFQDCVNLITVDDSVGFLGNLKTLRAMRCIKLRSIPPLKLASLEELDLSQCSCLESFPPVVDGLVDKLKTMTVRSCVKLRSIPTLKLTSLEELDLSNCFSLESFPLVVDGFLGKLKILLVKYCRNLRSIPPLRLDSLEKLDLSHCYSLESFPTVVDGLLDKLKFLSMEHCVKLTSIPSLRLTSLERFNLSHCLSLERFPKILGEMNNITEIHLDNTLIQELPFPFQNLTPPQTLYQCNCGVVYLSNRAAVMSKLAEFTIQAEEKVSPMQSSHVEYICLRNCKFSDEYLSTGLMLFTNVKELHLSDNQFKILPKSIEKCHFLQRLVLDNCEELQEIEGIPPCLKTLSALNCKSLTSPCKSKLLNQELHEAGNTWFRLPRTRIPEWFDHQCLAGLSISFWFRNKFPVIALCVVSPSTWDDSRRPVRVIINGDTFFYRHGENKRLSPEVYHLHLFHMQMEKLNNNMDKALLENKWNHAEVDFGFPFMYSGIHVLKKKSNMKDIQFTNPDKDDNIELTQYKRNSDSLVSVIASDVDKCE